MSLFAFNFLRKTTLKLSYTGSGAIHFCGCHTLKKLSSNSCINTGITRRKNVSITSQQFLRHERRISTVCQRFQSTLDSRCANSYLRVHKRSYIDRISKQTYSVANSFAGTSKLSNSGEPSNRSPVKQPRNIDEVVYHIQADLRQKRRIHRAEINNAVELIEKAGSSTDFASFLLNCCCDILPDIHPTNRVGLAKRIWKVIQDSNGYDVAKFEALLKVLALNEDESSDPFMYLELAEKNGINVSSTMYFFALLLVCQRGEIDLAVKILNMMKDKALPVNEKFFNVLMLGNARSGDITGAEEILKIMKRANIEPSSQTWATLLQIYIEEKNVESLKKIILKTKESELSEDQFYELLKISGRQSNQEILDLIIDCVIASGKMHYASIIGVVVQLMHLGHLENAYYLVLRFTDILKIKNEHLATFFIKELSGINMDPDIYIGFVESLQNSKLNPFALNLAAVFCLNRKKFQLAETVFAKMISLGLPVRPHYFLPNLIHEVEESQAMGAGKVLRLMKKFNVPPDWEMLSNWIVPNLFQLELKPLEIAKIIHEASGLSYSSGILSAVIAEAIKKNSIKEALLLLEQIKGKIINAEIIPQLLLSHIYTVVQDNELPNLRDIAKILQYFQANLPSNNTVDYLGSFMIKLIESDHTDIVETLAELLKVPISYQASQYLKSKTNVNDNLATEAKLKLPDYAIFNVHSKHILHPNEMDITGLESHKEELESKSMNARGTYRKIFLKYCQSGQLVKALETKTVFEKDFGELSPGMTSALMGAYIQNGFLDPALEAWESLVKINAHGDVDLYKIIDLATLMAQKGFVEKALELVQEECLSRTKVQYNTNFSRNIVTLLDSVSKATKSSDTNKDHVYSLTDSFLNVGYLKPSNANLGPAVKHLLRRNNNPAAVERLKEYAEKYRLAPCLQEVTYAVLQQPELLQKVKECSGAVKGVVEAKRLLALARSDVGDLDGAAALLRELGKHLSFVSIMKQCEYLASKRQIDKFINLVTSMHKTDLNYNCTKLYDIAINICNRNSDTEGLRKIISNMDEYDVYVSPTLRNMVIN